MGRCAQRIGATGLQNPVGDKRCAFVAVRAFQRGDAATGVVELSFAADIAAQGVAVAAFHIQYAVSDDIALYAADLTAITQLQRALYDVSAASVGGVECEHERTLTGFR